MNRPYPKDIERKLLITKELLQRNMTLKELSEEIGINYGYLSAITNGTNRSYKNEQKIATYFGKSREELFPKRTAKDIQEMRLRQLGGGAA